MEVPGEGEISKHTAIPALLTEAAIVESANFKIREVLGNYFTYLKHIGAGITGNVYLCLYTGNDARIKSLCDSNNRLSVKILMKEQELAHEAEIAQQLYDKRSIGQIQARHIIGIPVQKNNKMVALIMPYISYNDAPNDPQEDSLKSYLRKFFQSVVNGSISDKNISDKLLSALYDDYEIVYAQFINEMHSIIFEFHLLGYLHLDIASRNFLINTPVMDSEGNFIKFTLTLCDYGHTGKMDNGAVNTYHQRTNKPITARDYQDIVSHVATPNTDLFAFKCAVMGMISISIFNLMHDYHVLDIGQKSMKDFIELRSKKESFYKEDATVLTSYLKKLNEYVQLCPDITIKQKAKELLDFYKTYLVYLPPSNQDMTKVHESDRNQLLAANVAIFKSIVHDKIASIENANNLDELKKFMVSIKRLMQIPVTADFKNSDLYHQLKELDSIEKVKKFIKTKHHKVQQVSQKENTEPFLVDGSEQFKWIEVLEQAIRDWKLKHNRLEIKWYGKQFEQRVDGIINNIMKHKITSWQQAHENLADIEDEFTKQIAQKKLSDAVEFKKDAAKSKGLIDNGPSKDYDNKQIRK